ncbi:MAG: SAM-dependent chlorinase/fluorinase [Cyclobacteriaceae bacterium]|nr:SAM-dependent chlorinase/fluorinase [Cyclobacteriaceae bacterium]
MGLITFTSDFGEEDHYVAAVKATMLTIYPGLHIVDVSHQINPFDIAHGAFVLRSVYRDFPAGTIHLVAVDTSYDPGQRYIIIKLEDHYLIGPDNGILSLISDKEPTSVFVIDVKADHAGSFPGRDVLGRAAAMLAKGADLNEIGQPTVEYKRLLGRQLRATKKQIAGNVIRVDHYGNLITNIGQEIFRVLHQGRPFLVKFGKETSGRIHGFYTSVEPGECFIIFNSLGLMEIGINKGNASELLGLGYDSSVLINFEENP